MRRKPLVLVVDDEGNVRAVLAALLEQAGWLVKLAASADEASELVRAQDPDLVLTDLKMPGRDGMDLLRELRASFPEIPVVMLTAHGSVEHAVEAMKEGAFDFLTKPFDKEEVVDTLTKALGQAGSRRREFQGPPAAEARCGIVGSSEAMDEVYRRIEKVAPSPATVLVTGETGTGKELVARALHALSPRADAPFVCINCGALPENLVESELFGHVKGAFTGAERDRPGRFELADGGTLFLDEIGELPAAQQVKLLRVLEDGQVLPVGGAEPREVDVRLVAATNRDLGEEVREGRFREDLLFRLQVIEIRVPSLAQRREDVPELLEFFLDKHAARLGVPRRGLAEGTADALAGRGWPGNVRQLENAAERALLLAEGPELDLADFETVSGDPDSGGEPVPEGDLKAASKAAAAKVERRMIQAALDATGDNVTQAAERLGLSRRGLQLKLKELGLRD